mgnify:CR=1 FL=1
MLSVSPFAKFTEANVVSAKRVPPVVPVVQSPAFCTVVSAPVAVKVLVMVHVTSPLDAVPAVYVPAARVSPLVAISLVNVVSV